MRAVQPGRSERGNLFSLWASVSLSAPRPWKCPPVLRTRLEQALFGPLGRGWEVLRET
jgi:hypothetical protein